MKTPSRTTQRPIASLLRTGALALSLLLLAGSLEAGTINLNLTNTTPTGTGSDGNGILGGGTWNRLHKDQRALANALVKNNGAASPVTVTQSAGPEPDTYSEAINGNPVQGEGWYHGDGFTLALSGLRPSQIHTVAVYSDRIPDVPNFEIAISGSGDPVAKSAPHPGSAPTVLPGAEGPDYLLFTVTTNASGGLSIATNYNMVGVQIRGVLPGEDGPQADALVTKSRTAKSGKGNNVYGINPDRRQTLTQKAAGKRPRTYYSIMQNDGAEIDKMFLMAFLDPPTRTTVFDMTTRKNVTAKARARNYRFDLEANAARKFRVTVASKKQKLARTSSVAICSSPSTLKTKKQDCVTCGLRP